MITICISLYTTDTLRMEGQVLQSMAQQQKFMNIKRKILLKQCQSKPKVDRGLKLFPLTERVLGKYGTQGVQVQLLLVILERRWFICVGHYVPQSL